MKHNLWYKGIANNHQNDYKNVQEKGNLTTMTTNSIKKKSKRVRSAFTTDQVKYLEREFKKYPYIGTLHRKEIATSLNIAERTVKIWFQNRRMKEKRETITKEFCDEQTGRTQAEFAKNAITVQSTNDQSLNSLPLITFDYNNSAKLVMNNKNNNIERHRETSNDPSSKFLQKSNLQKTNSEPTPLPYVKCHSFPKRLSTKSTNNTCKNMIKTNNCHQTKSSDTRAKKQGHSLPMNNSSKASAQDLSTKRTLLQPDPNLSAEYSHGMSGYVPIVPNFYPQHFVTPGGVLWKPVNIMPIMPKSCSTSSAMDFKAMRTQGRKTATKMCNCNCHSKSFPINIGIPNVPSPQYVLTALPLPQPSTKC